MMMIFFQTGDLLHYYIDTLNAYLIEQHKIRISGDRADELE